MSHPLHIQRDQVIDQLNGLKRLKIPRYKGFGQPPVLGQVGDEPGMEGDIILDRNTGQFCYHDGTTWVCLGGQDQCDCTLAETLVNGNVTGGTSIVFNNGDQAQGGCGFLDLDFGAPVNGVLLKGNDNVGPGNDGCNVHVVAGNSANNDGGDVICHGGDVAAAGGIAGLACLEGGVDDAIVALLPTAQICVGPEGDGTISITGTIDSAGGDFVRGQVFRFHDSDLDINALNGSTGDGADITIVTGTAAVASSSNGGTLSLRTGNGAGGGLGSSGGNMNFTTGTSSLEGRGGDVTMTTGDGQGFLAASGVAGSFTFNGGEGSIGGNFIVNAGNTDGSSGGSVAGAITMNAGGNSAGAFDGGFVTLNGGPSLSGQGGFVLCNGGNSNVSAGGGVVIQSGRGDAINTNSGAVGGIVTIRSGPSGNPAVPSQGSGPSGNINIETPTVVPPGAEAYTSGDVAITTGDANGIGAMAGQITLTTGAGIPLNPLAIRLRTGDVSSNDPPGSILFAVGSKAPGAAAASTFTFEAGDENAVHIRTIQPNKPTVSDAGGAGLAPVLLWGTDTAGVVSIPNVGETMNIRVNYFKSHPDNHVVVISPMNQKSAEIQLFVDFASADDAGFNVQQTITDNSPGTVLFSYHVISAA